MGRPAFKFRQPQPDQKPAAPAPPPPRPESRRPSSSPAGTDAGALTELKSAAATHDFLRRKGDSAQFWEALLLARSRRAIVAPPEGAPAAPTPELEAAIVGELDQVRRQHAPLVRDLRNYLKPVQGLPEPADRFEMALAFLLASTREHHILARWLAEPEKHRGKAAEKLRSLATITDPYREALRPWTLEAPGGVEGPPPNPAATPPSPEASAPDSETLGGLRLAIRCREALSGIYLDVDLWETLLLVMSQPEPTRTALDRIEQDAEAERLEDLEAKAEVLFKKVAALRSEHGSWLQPLKEAILKEGAMPEDPILFEIALALLVVGPGMTAWAGLWLKDPRGCAKEAVDRWARSIARAKLCRSALAAT